MKPSQECVTVPGSVCLNRSDSDMPDVGGGSTTTKAANFRASNGQEEVSDGDAVDEEDSEDECLSFDDDMSLGLSPSKPYLDPDEDRREFFVHPLRLKIYLSDEQCSTQDV